MKKFNFQYENILEFKKKNEEDAQNKLSNELTMLEEEKMKLMSLQNNMNGTYGKLNELMTEGIDVSILKMYDLFIANLNGRIKRQSNTIQNHSDKANQLRQELLKVSKELKIFEKLKEHYQNEYDYYIKKEEEKLMDQLVTYKSFIK